MVTKWVILSTESLHTCVTFKTYVHQPIPQNLQELCVSNQPILQNLHMYIKSTDTVEPARFMYINRYRRTCKIYVHQINRHHGTCKIYVHQTNWYCRTCMIYVHQINWYCGTCKIYVHQPNQYRRTCRIYVHQTKWYCRTLLGGHKAWWLWHFDGKKIWPWGSESVLQRPMIILFNSVGGGGYFSDSQPFVYNSYQIKQNSRLSAFHFLFFYQFNKTGFHVSPLEHSHRVYFNNNYEEWASTEGMQNKLSWKQKSHRNPIWYFSLMK